jgi:hypothetical protein
VNSNSNAAELRNRTIAELRAFFGMHEPMEPVVVRTAGASELERAAFHARRPVDAELIEHRRSDVDETDDAGVPCERRSQEAGLEVRCLQRGERGLQGSRRLRRRGDDHGVGLGVDLLEHATELGVELGSGVAVDLHDRLVARPKPLEPSDRTDVGQRAVGAREREHRTEIAITREQRGSVVAGACEFVPEQPDLAVEQQLVVVAREPIDFGALRTAGTGHQRALPVAGDALRTRAGRDRQVPVGRGRRRVDARRARVGDAAIGQERAQVRHAVEIRGAEIRHSDQKHATRVRRLGRAGPAHAEKAAGGGNHDARQQSLHASTTAGRAGNHFRTAKT